jgi:hypothetical protein
MTPRQTKQVTLLTGLNPDVYVSTDVEVAALLRFFNAHRFDDEDHIAITITAYTGASGWGGMYPAQEPTITFVLNVNPSHTTDRHLILAGKAARCFLSKRHSQKFVPMTVSTCETYSVDDTEETSETQ